MNENFDITYKALFRRYYPSLIFYATRLVGEEEAEDVVQDVFVELWKRHFQKLQTATIHLLFFLLC